MDKNTNDVQGLASTGFLLYGQDHGNKIHCLEDSILELEKATTKLTLSDDKAISFFNLGFTLKRDLDAWFNIHALTGSFGFVIDFHTFLEHVHQSITGMDALKQLQTVYKFSLSTISEALTVTLFKASVPHFLSSSGAHRIVENDCSYFSHIYIFLKWNDPISGYKFQLKKELETFCRAHLSNIFERISPRSQLFHLATRFLT